MDQVELRARYDFHHELLGKLRKAYLALVDGGVKSYTIDDRTLTRFDLGDLRRQIREEEARVDELAELLRGGRPRRTVGILPRDW